MLGFRFLMLSVLLATAPITAAARDGTVVVYVTRSPFTVIDHRPAPIMKRWAAELSRQSGLELELRILDFGRSYEQLRQRSDVCTVGLIRTPEREAEVSWLTPMLKDEYVLITPFQTIPVLVPVDDPVALDKLIDGSIAAADGAMFDQLQSRGIRAVRVADQDASLDLVLNHRTRYGLVSRLTLQAAGSKAGDLSVVGKLGPITGWLACGRSMPAEFQTRLIRAQAALSNDEAGRRILADLAPKPE